MKRRDSLKLIALAPISAGIVCSDAGEIGGDGAPQAVKSASEPFEGYELAFFTDDEFAAIRQLADIIIPADERSGSASQARVPEFIDFTVNDREELQTRVRGGLHWLDYRCQRNYGARFIDCSEQEQLEAVDEIAWPDTASPDVEVGVAFFNTLRNLVAYGFWSSKTGVEDLRYSGNQALASWDGCPAEALDRLGVSYG